MAWLVTLITTLLGFLPEKFYEQISDHFSDQKKVRQEFMEIYMGFRFTKMDYQLDQNLKRLRDFFQREYKLLEKQEITQFYAKWIEKRWIAIEFDADDAFWTQARHQELIKDLDNIKSLI
ncbi:MAG TPA: hypothetical protein VK388_16745 [Pyrinomonadaceae bacterium]|nr:hypothetical protein [Pyrinomonadaceae bacterium]